MYVYMYIYMCVCVYPPSRLSTHASLRTARASVSVRIYKYVYICIYL